ncbi:MAG: RraA family protein [Synergistaceae bacterium]|jgi:regulator of RNase E activity RraA|nr:RraA family protein [Synergistaceae bacterium]
MSNPEVPKIEIPKLPREKRLSKEIIDAYKKLDTTSISDALNRFGVNSGLHGIKPIQTGLRLCGQAFTCMFAVSGGKKETNMDYLDDVEPGDVVVIDNGGKLDYSCWGDLMSMVAKRNGVAGTVIDGIVRDIPAQLEMGYPMFAKDIFMWTGKQRYYLEAVQIPVHMSGIRVNPGDIMFGDDTGVLVVPFELAEETLKAAQEINEREEVIVGFIKEGMRLDEARVKTGYYFLQAEKEKEAKK